MAQLNYHHLRYFWVVAREKNLTRAARSLNVSPSALSTQLRSLESSLGQQLFDRTQKSLALSEAGKVALQFAETIFKTGTELLETLAGKNPAQRQSIRIGAVATLSRNFVLEFLRPTLGRSDVQLTLRSGNMRELLVQLEARAIDILLTNHPVRTDIESQLSNHLISEHPVSLVGVKKLRLKPGKFPENVAGVPLVLPSRESAIRAAFDTMMENSGVPTTVAAEVDDMAMLRLLAREGLGLALVPSVVVQDEVKDGVLREVLHVPGLVKPFYAITQKRRFPNPLALDLLNRATGKIGSR